MEIWENISKFVLLGDPNVLYVVVGLLLIGAASAVIGTFMVLRQQSLIGDAVAHSVLPGICLAFIFFETKNPFILLAGAFVSGWLSSVCIEYVARHTRLKQDAVIGVVLSVFFGLGMLLLTSIQQSGNAAQSGLDKFLFGKAAAILPQDIQLFSIVVGVILGFVLIFYNEFRLVIFDKTYARSIGLKVRFYEILISSLGVLAITVGIQAVGVVLMSALLITPTVAARYWTNKLVVILLLSAFFGMLSSYFGGMISYLAPSMPTGPWVVVVLTFTVFFSMLFAPQKGFVWHFFSQRKTQGRIIEENILKLLYQLGEKADNFDLPYNIEQMQDRRYLPTRELQRGLQRLCRQDLLIQNSKTWQLSDLGVQAGRRMVRLHRMWELYLTKYLKLQDDHVHETAEAIEHILTPEMEARLEKALDFPETDPHQSPIPRG